MGLASDRAGSSPPVDLILTWYRATMRGMGTTASIIQHAAKYSDRFRTEHSDYLSFLDQLVRIQGKAGLEEAALGALNQPCERCFKTALLLAECANTSALGALNLLASNFVSDAFALIRLCYEASCLLFYGAESTPSGLKVYDAFFGPTRSEDERRKAELAVTRKALDAREAVTPGADEVRRMLNNYGAHISQAKIALGNVTNIGHSSASSFFVDNRGLKHYTLGLDLLYGVWAMTTEAFDAQTQRHKGRPASIATELGRLNRRFETEIRPQLRRAAQET